MRFQLPSGKDSRKVLGPAWLKRGRPPHGCLTEGEALVRAEAFAAEHSADTSDPRRTYAAALAAFLRYCKERGLRGSTLHEYAKIGERLGARPWRRDLQWRDRALDTFAEVDLLVLRSELIDAGRSADTLNHYRRVVRGVFGTQPSSPALSWEWQAPKVESEGKLRFYTPEQVDRLVAAAEFEKDAAIFTLATEAGPRLSEIRALKVEDVDYEVEVLRFEDGFTTYGGFAGNKGRRTRSVPMSANVGRVLRPFCEGKAPGALVFEHDSKPGEPIDYMDLYRRFLKACERAALPRICFHELRHTFGTQAIRTFKIHEVQRMMGHRRITTTERYLHYVADSEGAAKLTALWGDRGAGEGGSGPAPAEVIPLRRAA
jgi:integrase